MPWAFYPIFAGLRSGQSATRQRLPVWTDTQPEEAPKREFTIRNVLCAVDLSHHSRNTVSRAARWPLSLAARLTLVHVTASVEI